MDSSQSSARLQPQQRCGSDPGHNTTLRPGVSFAGFAIGLMSCLPLAAQAAYSSDVLLTYSSPNGSGGVVPPPHGVFGAPESVSLSIGGPGAGASFIGNATDVPLKISVKASADASDPGTSYATAQGRLRSGGTSYSTTYRLGYYAAPCQARCSAPATPPPVPIPVSATFSLDGSTTITGVDSYVDVTATAWLGSVTKGALLPHFIATTPLTSYSIGPISTIVPSNMGPTFLALGASISLNATAMSGGTASADFSHTFKLVDLTLPEGYVLVDDSGQVFTPSQLVSTVPEAPSATALALGLFGLWGLLRCRDHTRNPRRPSGWQ